MTRQKQGSCAVRKGVSSGRTPGDWISFLCEDDNETKFFKFLADRIASLETNKDVYFTHGENVLCNSNKDTFQLPPCNHGEADTRMFVHVRLASCT